MSSDLSLLAMRKYGLIPYLVFNFGWDGMGWEGKEIGVRYIPLHKLNLCHVNLMTVASCGSKCTFEIS